MLLKLDPSVALRNGHHGPISWGAGGQSLLGWCMIVLPHSNIILWLYLLHLKVKTLMRGIIVSPIGIGVAEVIVACGEEST